MSPKLSWDSWKILWWGQKCNTVYCYLGKENNFILKEFGRQFFSPAVWETTVSLQQKFDCLRVRFPHWRKLIQSTQAEGDAQAGSNHCLLFLTSVIYSLELEVLWWHCWIFTASEGLANSLFFQPGVAETFHVFLHCTSSALFCWITHCSFPTAKILNYAKSPYSPSLHLWCAEFSPLKEYLCCPDGILPEYSR